mgnify:CR=1 FL=1|jgi:hypothetical protein
MLILPGAQKVAIIDPTKKMGETGQYVAYDGNCEELEAVIMAARKADMELRYYYTEISDGNGECVPIKVIITEIPDGHIQPFHTHTNVHEISTVLQGQLIAIDSDTLKEGDCDKIRVRGSVVEQGASVIADRGVRHTVANFSGARTVFITNNVLPLPTGKDFKPDWK